MKLLRKTHSTSNSCSCTSCVYKSESDHPSLQRLVLKGSKIDRLYYGKYIPLREKKLLDKLVRTRGVYDDIRAQLVSESASSLQKNADFNVKSSPSNELKKSSAIFEIVNLVDKGAALKSPSLSECCSCCSCSSTTHFHQNKRSRKLHQRRHALGDLYEGVTLRQDMKKRKGVKFLPKHIKSDPCTCTFQFFGKEKFKLDSNIESSLNNDEEIQPKRRKFKRMNKKSLQSVFDSKTEIKNKYTAGVQMLKNSKTLLQDTLAIRVKESLDKVKRLKIPLKPLKKTPAEDQYYIPENRKVTILKNAGRPSYEKIRASQIRFKNKIFEGEENLVMGAKKSFKKVKQTTNKINTNIKGSMDRLITKNKQKKNAKKIFNILPPDKHTEIALKIRKDSIVKFKEDLNRRKLLNDWIICEEGCIENICNPEQCFEKLKLKRAQKLKRRGNRDKSVINIPKTKHREKMISTSTKSSNVRIQTGPAVKESQIHQKMPVPDNTKKPKIKISIKQIQNLMKKQKRSNLPSDKRNILVKNRRDITFTSDNGATTRQPVRIGSSFSFNVDYKGNPPQNIPRTLSNYGGDVSKSSGITLSHQKRQKHKKLKKGEKGSQVSLKLRRINNKRLATHYKQSYTSSRKTKSTSSVASKMKSSGAKQVQSVIIPRRKKIMEQEKLKLHSRKVIGKSQPRHNGNVVRIGSTFSFNIEFYKNSRIPYQQDIENLTNIKSLSIKPKIKGIKKEKNKNYSQKNLYKEKKRKTSTASTETIDNSDNFKTRDRSTVTENQLYYLELEPYECEPGICVQGECNPYQCLQRIMRRNNTRDVSLGTVSPENKSTYSHTKIKRNNTKDVILGTVNPENKSTYSYTKNKSKAAFIQSKPKTKGRKILVKSKIHDTKIRKPHVAKVGFENRSKQAVHIGSSFSFNIEFSKNYTKKDFKHDIKPSAKPINISTRKKVQQKGVEIEKKVGNVDTQMHTIKKSKKSSLVGPMLKRCFCTLNLYKKQKGDFNKLKKKHPLSTVYTVNTAFIQNNKSSLLKQNIYGDLLSKQSTLHLIPIHTKLSTKQSLQITSDLSLNVELVKKSLKSYNKYLKQSCSSIESRSSLFNRKNSLTGLSKYLKRCFCLMNMQYENKLRKLEPYECEPGVCIPGQCDPYECQKRIMKRLQKGYSKLSGTDSMSRSISSSQTPKTPTQSHLIGVALKPQTKKKEKSKQTFKNQIKPQGKKQAVRIGSSFSFDVEFYKNLHTGKTRKYTDNDSTRSATKSKGVVKPSQTGYKEKYKSKNMYTKPDFKDSNSQFRQKTKHQGAHALQDMNRCFCTLKLHKKGKRKTYSTVKNQTTLPYEPMGITTVSRGQNTKGFKGVQDLLPYECEPGTCIPGECNPYECLARINKRNLREKGMGTITTASTAFSNTIGTKKIFKTRAVGLGAKTATSAASSKTIGTKKKFQTRAVKIKQIKSKAKYVRRVDTRKFNKTPHNTKRQAVRIGSSFSFNIDFYKGANSFQSKKKVLKDKRKPKHKKSGQKESKNKESKYKEAKRTSTKISTVFPTSRTRVSQTSQTPRKNMATMVKPFLKRCFCTLQLRNQRQLKEKSNQIKQTKYKSAMTMTEITDHKRKLDPYECEPGVCIPYRCDPYECEKLIKRRLNIDMNNPGTFINENYNLLPYECEPNFCTPGKCDPRVCFERIKKRNDFNKTSVGHTYSTFIKNKHKSQFKRPSVEKLLGNKIKQAPKYTSTRKTRHEQPVKAGSNLSFNEKLLKDKALQRHNTFSDTEIQRNSLKSRYRKRSKHFKIVQDDKRHSTSHSRTLVNSKSAKSGIISNLHRCFCTLSLRKSQEKKSTANNTEVTKPVASAVNTFMKKCFCTLKLNTNRKQNTPQIKVDIKPHTQKNKFEKLKPYECEPYTCIPGECDPYECEKLIRKRLLRENKTKGQQLRIRKYDASQLTHLQTKSTSTLTDPLLKRCFCTLQLKKNAVPKYNNLNSISKQPPPTITQDKMTYTKNADVSYNLTSPYECPPFFCIPNQCDPYECEKNLRRLNNRQKSVRHPQTVATATAKQERQKTHQSVEVRPLQKKSQKTQSDIFRKASESQHEQNIVEIPRFTNYLNKKNRRGVKIGSNMSFNIEFYKEYTSPVPTFKSKKDVNLNRWSKPLKDESDTSSSYAVRKKQLADKDVSSFRSKIRNAESQVKNKTDNKSSNTINKLKRCFCTLTLQKPIANTEVPYPQAFEVRRAAVQKTKTFHFEKPIKTRPNSKIRLIVPAIDNEMQTILSYKPKKFNKKYSETVLIENNFKNRLSKKRITWLSKKRLSKKQSAHPINIKTPPCYCKTTTMLKPHIEKTSISKTKRNKQKSATNNLKSSLSDRRSKEIKQIPKVKISKSMVFSNKGIGKKSKHLKNNIHSLLGNKFEAGDARDNNDNEKTKTVKKYIKKTNKKNIEGNKINPKEFPKVETVRYEADHRDNNDNKKTKTVKEYINKTSKNNIEGDKKKPKKFSKGQTVRNEIGNRDNNDNKKTKTVKEYINETSKKNIEDDKRKPKELTKVQTVRNETAQCPYCGRYCGKGGLGDFILNKFNSCLQKIRVLTKEEKIRKKVAKRREKKQRKVEEIKPLFNMYLETDSFSIINKEEVTEKVTRLKTKNSRIEKNLQRKKHDKFCTCCICLGKKGVSKKGKGKQQHIVKESKKSRNSKKETEQPPCVCGSEICAADVKNMKKSKLVRKEKAIPPCFCGSPICAEETEILNTIAKGPGANICMCRKEMDDRKQKQRKQYEKTRRLLSAQNRQADRERRRRRQKNDQLLEKSINGNKSDVLLVAESVIDVAKLGFTGVGDILRILYRCAKDPKHTWHSMKAMTKDPTLVAKTLKDTYNDTGVAATARRIGKRVSKMGSVEETKRLLEQHAVTNYILHIADKDPKKRLRMRRRIPQKEQLNLGCNLYASSLRKRKFLWVFNRWPWFYPHCLSLVNVWKQFAELLTFLLAVVVWSPCIFATEICRAVMCCTLCTG